MYPILLLIYRDFLLTATGKLKDFHEYSEDDWKLVNLEFVSRCTDAEIALYEYLQELISIGNLSDRQKIVEYWLDGIKQWYIDENIYMLEHSICSYFAPKAYPKRVEPKDARK